MSQHVPLHASQGSDVSQSSDRSARALAGATAVLVAVDLASYLAVLRSQGGQAPLWYVSVLVVVVALSGAAVARRSRAAMTISAALLGPCVLVGLLSIGPLLVPALVTAILAAVLAGPRARAAARPRSPAQA